jgi:hypothetical protein
MLTVLIGDKLTIRPFSSTSTAAARMAEYHTPTFLPDLSKIITIDVNGWRTLPVHALNNIFIGRTPLNR